MFPSSTFMNSLDLMLDLKSTRVSQAKENVGLFPQGPTGHIARFFNKNKNNLSIFVQYEKEWM